jgi:hypothetical protein
MLQLANNGDLTAAEIVARRCADRLIDYQARIALAKQLIAKPAYAEVIILLQDVETWQARRDEKVDAWLQLCDAHLAVGHTEESKRCLRRLDASPDMLTEREPEILRRIEAINHPAPPPAPAPPAP